MAKNAEEGAVIKLQCPIPGCKVELSSVKDFGNHFVDGHEFAAFGREGQTTNGALSHWDGEKTSLGRYKKDAKGTARRAAKKKADKEGKQKDTSIEEEAEDLSNIIDSDLEANLDLSNFIIDSDEEANLGVFVNSYSTDEEAEDLSNIIDSDLEANLGVFVNRYSSEDEAD